MDEFKRRQSIGTAAETRGFASVRQPLVLRGALCTAVILRGGFQFPGQQSLLKKRLDLEQKNTQEVFRFLVRANGPGSFHASPSSSGPGRRPLTPVTGVQIPVGTPLKNIKGLCASINPFFCLKSERRHRSSLYPVYYSSSLRGPGSVVSI